jgi:hypothetical protein
MKTKHTLYDLVACLADNRLPLFSGSGSKRDGMQVHFGRGKGMFFLAQTLYVQKSSTGKLSLKNTATAKTNY